MRSKKRWFRRARRRARTKPSSCATATSTATTAKGVRKAVRAVNDVLGPAIEGLDATAQREIDATLIELDGYAEQSRISARTRFSASRSPSRAPPRRAFRCRSFAISADRRRRRFPFR